jgi:hypothetical protein
MAQLVQMMPEPDEPEPEPVIVDPDAEPEPAPETEPDPLKEPVPVELLFPFDYEGAHITELTIDLVGLDSRAWRTLEKSYSLLYPNEFTPVLMHKPAYQELVAARAAKVSPKLIQALKGPDYIKVTGLVFQFLGNSLARSSRRARPSPK